MRSDLCLYNEFKLLESVYKEVLNAGEKNLNISKQENHTKYWLKIEDTENCSSAILAMTDFKDKMHRDSLKYQFPKANFLEEQYFVEVSSISSVIHFKNIMVPSIHFNFRSFTVNNETNYSGGIDISPSYLEVNQILFFTRYLQKSLDYLTDNAYYVFSYEAEKYFRNTHRKDNRGAGGCFFENLSQNNYVEEINELADKLSLPISSNSVILGRLTEVIKSLINSIPNIIIYILHTGNYFSKLLKEINTDADLNRWKYLRWGRYSEFNLIHDRGVKFGLACKNPITVQILLSTLPPVAKWEESSKPLNALEEISSLFFERTIHPMNFLYKYTNLEYLESQDSQNIFCINKIIETIFWQNIDQLTTIINSVNDIIYNNIIKNISEPYYWLKLVNEYSYDIKKYAIQNNFNIPKQLQIKLPFSNNSFELISMNSSIKQIFSENPNSDVQVFENWCLETQSSLKEICFSVSSDKTSATITKQKIYKPSENSQTILLLIQQNDNSLFSKGGIAVTAGSHSNTPKFLAELHDQDENDIMLMTGISSVIHSNHPRVPTLHFNVRRIQIGTYSYYGFGIDLTPKYISETCSNEFHKYLKSICGENYQIWSDRAKIYFSIKHREKNNIVEERGCGGIFVDKYNFSNIDDAIKLFNELIIGTIQNFYMPYCLKNVRLSFCNSEVLWQNHRWSKYVEFNLLYDRGTRFGLELLDSENSPCHVESILLSMPPYASWSSIRPGREECIDSTLYERLIEYCKQE